MGNVTKDKLLRYLTLLQTAFRIDFEVRLKYFRQNSKEYVKYIVNNYHSSRPLLPTTKYPPFLATFAEGRF